MKLCRRVLGVACLVALIVSVGGLGALAALTDLDLYAMGDSEPEGSFSALPPPNVPLPNYDPGRDTAPGLLLQKTDGGVNETDPSKYQQWVGDPSPVTLEIGDFVIWAAIKNFDPDKTGLLSLYLLDCASSCVLLDTAAAKVSGSGWNQITASFDIRRTFVLGHSIAVKVVVDDSSEDDMWLAYGTQTYNARLETRVAVPLTTTTTTTTTTSTTTSTTTTTQPTTTTSTTAPGNGSTTTTQPGQGTTTTSTTHPGQDTPTTTTTTPGSNATTPAGLGDQSLDTTTTAVPASSGVENDEESSLIAPLGSDDPPPPPPNQPVVVAGSSSQAGGLTAEIPARIELTPQEGLTVAFSTVVQSFRSSWLTLLGLGLLGALLLLSLVNDDGETDGPSSAAALDLG